MPTSGAPINVDDSEWTDRPALMTDLANAIEKPSFVALVGLGGSGKSFLAWRLYHYLLRVHRGALPMHYVPVEAMTREALVARLLRSLGRDVSDDARANQDALNAAWRDPFVPPGFLLLDNADDKGEIRDFLPPRGAGWRVLVTCQRPSCLGTVEKAFKQIRVEAFKREESLALFESRLDAAKFAKDRSEIDALCKELGDLPIAVAAAAGAIANSGFSVKTWRRRFQEDMDAFQANAPLESGLSAEQAHRKNLIRVVLRMGLRALSDEAEPQRGDAWTLLGALAHFSPDCGATPAQLAAVARLATLSADGASPGEREADTAPEEDDRTEALNDAALALVRRSVIVSNGPEEGRRYLLHRLMARAVDREIGDPDRPADSVAPATAASLPVFRLAFCRFWTGWAVAKNRVTADEAFLREMDNLLQAREQLFDNRKEGDGLESLRMDFAAATWQWMAIQRADSLAGLVKMVRIAESEAPDGSKGKANTLQALGDLAVREDRLSDAAGFYEKAAAIYPAIGARLGEANTLKALGDLKMRQGDFEEAEKNLESAIRLHQGAQDQLGLRADFGITGRLFLATGRPALAVLAFQRSLEALPPEADGHGYRLSLRGQAEAFQAMGWPSGMAACFQRLDELPGAEGGALEKYLSFLKENNSAELAEQLREEAGKREADGWRLGHVGAAAKEVEKGKEEAAEDTDSEQAEPDHVERP